MSLVIRASSRARHFIPFHPNPNVHRAPSRQRRGIVHVSELETLLEIYLGTLPYLTLASFTEFFLATCIVQAASCPLCLLLASTPLCELTRLVCCTSLRRYERTAAFLRAYWSPPCSEYLVRYRIAQQVTRARSHLSFTANPFEARIGWNT